MKFKVREHVNIIKDGSIFTENAVVSFKDKDKILTVNYDDDKTGYFTEEGKHIFVANIYLEKIQK